jgi:exodeoxyribonuclease VII small subunit
MSEDPRPEPVAPPAPTEPFEKVMDRLAQVVTELEKGELPLERALVLFEEGVRLSREGTERLDRAEARVEELLGRSLRPLARPGEGDSREPRPDRGRRSDSD